MKARLEIPLTLSEIASVLGCVHFEGDRVIRSVCTDSRELEDDGIFFAFENAECYVEEALSKGLTAVSAKNERALCVQDVRWAFCELAKYYKGRLCKLRKTVAVTGSVGKSCVKDFTHYLLSGVYKTHKTDGNFNNDIGLPLTIFSTPKSAEILVVEMGMNHEGEIARLSEIANPDIAVITNVGTSHIGNLGSREAIARAKLEIIAGLNTGGTCIIPSNEPLLSQVKGAVTVGEGGDTEVTIKETGADHTLFDIRTNEGVISNVRLPLGGIHYPLNLALAVTASLAAGMDIKDIKKALLDCSGFTVRQKFTDLGELTVYDDSYNASLESYTAAFGTLSQYNGTKSAVIGDVLELGSMAKDIHERIGSMAVKHGIDKLYAFGTYAEDTARGALRAGLCPSRIFINTDRSAPQITAEQILKALVNGETVLVKGSHALHTERIIDYLKKLKGEKND